MRVFLGVTGASGAPYAARLLQALAAGGHEIGLVASAAGVEVIATELYGDAEPAARRGARALRRRRGRPGHGLRDQRLQEPVRQRLGEGRRVHRVPVLDEHGRHPRHRRDGEPDPPGRLGRAEGASQARARSARDAAVADPSARARDAARGRRGDPVRGARLLPRCEDDRRPRRLRRRPRSSTRSASTRR